MKKTLFQLSRSRRACFASWSQTFWRQFEHKWHSEKDRGRPEVCFSQATVKTATRKSHLLQTKIQHFDKDANSNDAIQEERGGRKKKNSHCLTMFYLLSHILEWLYFVMEMLWVKHLTKRQRRGRRRRRRKEEQWQRRRQRRWRRKAAGDTSPRGGGYGVTWRWCER